MGKKAKTPPAEAVTVTYDLFDLPTAQHKAGLAGLLLQIRSMRDRKRHDSGDDYIPTFELTAPTAATVHFTPASVQGLFDDLYAAGPERVFVKTRWQGQEPIDTVEVDEPDPGGGPPKKARRFVYEIVQPCGRFLRQYLPSDMDRTKDWHKLWRDMLWAIPRGNPQSRIPFEQRAKGQPCREGQTAWEDLVKVAEARRAGKFHTSAVAGSLWLGAQATNAEAIPFQGRAEQNLLLHFWPLTALVFAPQQLDSDGNSDYVGYVLAIPEVLDLENFLADYPQMLQGLGKEVRGYRPAEAVIDLPDQGALQFMEHLARVAQRKAEGSSLAFSVASVEFLHLAKFGNNIKSMAAGRVGPELLRGYRSIVGEAGTPSPYRNPIFRRGLMLALLNAQEWYEPFAGILTERAWPFYLHSAESPRKLPPFAADATARFALESREYQQETESMSQPNASHPAELPLLIHRLVKCYVTSKAKEKAKVPKKKLKDLSEEQRKEVYEQKERIAASIFLEMRSRRDQDFVDHFTATFCSTKQYLPEWDFQVVAKALLSQPDDGATQSRDDVKTLTLLALSANS